MKKLKNKQSVKQYRRNLYDSPHKKMSEGADYISKTITWPRGENWRGNKEGKK